MRKNVGSISDEELLHRYREKQDPEILGSLYRPYMYLVYGLCMKYLKNREDSQDAVMQIFEVLVRDVPRFEIRNFRSWLYGVSRNYCLMQLRKGSGEREKIREFSDGMLMESTRVSHPIDEAENDDLHDRLKSCLEQLKEDQRRCVELFYFEHKSYREIASGLQIGEQHVKSFIQNGKRNLRICLESKQVAGNARN